MNNEGESFEGFPLFVKTNIESANEQSVCTEFLETILKVKVKVKVPAATEKLAHKARGHDGSAASAAPCCPFEN